MKEARIVINGKALTMAQSMTVRVALGINLFECGEDVLGHALQGGYLDRSREVLELIHGAIKNHDTVGE